MKKLIFTIVFLQSIFVYAQTNTVKTIWKSYSEKVDFGYFVQFKYPSYLKFDRIENCMCLGRPSKTEEYNNTMDWGIWMDEVRNYKEPDSSELNLMFNNDYIIAQKDTIVISKYKAIKTLIKQSHGKMYSETIVVKLKDCIFEITNNKGESEDFKTFYNSINITPITK